MIDFSIFGSKARQLAGLDISSSSVKMVELVESEKGGFRVERYAIEPLPREAVVDGNIANLDAVTEGVKRLVRRFGPGVKNVAMALPASSVITKK
ncbi:MAG: pilus assembly protein PilM, partial [Azoarcus sp. PHD]